MIYKIESLVFHIKAKLSDPAIRFVLRPIPVPSVPVRPETGSGTFFCRFCHVALERFFVVFIHRFFVVFHSPGPPKTTQKKTIKNEKTVFFCNQVCKRRKF